MDEKKLEKRIKVLEKKLNRSEVNRRLLQDVKDKNQELLNRLHEEVYESKKIIEKRNEELYNLNEELSFEKEKSEKLLLNILPVRVANDLKRKGNTRPKSYEDVTVYFSDIVGFTEISSEIEPNDLIDELNEIFTAFDNIIEENNCERIKTIGDAYLAVCGMHKADVNHAENIAKSAIQIMKYLKKRGWSNSKIKWKIRIGIHSGPIIGGVVGVKKYIYDVFGDTVNIAARMEQNSEEMMINVSDATYNLIKDKFEFIEREPIEYKGKGLMKTWYLQY